MLRICVAIGLVLACGIAHAEIDPALAGLEKALPGGWSLINTESELVIRHDRPVYSAGQHLPNERPGSKPTGAAGGPLITLELRYHLQPKWSERQLADARTANDKVYAEAKALRAQFRIDAIPLSKGRPLPANADERARLAAYDKANAKVMARLVPVPLCSLGNVSLIDGDATYSQLGLELDPPEAMREAHQVVEIVKQRCGAT